MNSNSKMIFTKETQLGILNNKNNKYNKIFINKV